MTLTQKTPSKNQRWTDGNEVAVYGEQFVESACSGSETKYDDRDFDEEYFLDLDPVVAEGKFIRKEEHGLSPPQ